MADKIKEAEKVEKIKKIHDKSVVEDLFSEVQDEINDDIVKESKAEIKNLLVERNKAQQILDNYDRRIDELKLKISQRLKV